MYAPVAGIRGIGDAGFCALHHRKRARIDLIPLDDGDGGATGRMRCRPLHECRPREVADVTLVTCHIHGKRRNVLQMREVQPGVWECQANAVCRFFSSAVGGGGNMTATTTTTMMAMASGVGYGQTTPYSGGGDAVVDGNAAYDAAAATASVWSADAVMGDGGATSRPVQGAASDTAAAAVLLAERKVWCALHGKRLPERLCVLAEDCCYFCRDAAMCLSTPLDTAADALAYGCTELLCARHHTLRSAGFVELDASRSFYVCVPGHTCTHVTLPGLRRAQESSLQQQQQQEQQQMLSYAQSHVSDAATLHDSYAAGGVGAASAASGVDVDRYDAASAGRDVDVSAFLL